MIAFDPFFPKEEAAELGVTLCSLEEVFANSDVVSLHAPHLPETEGMIRAEHFAAMKKGASFINTARAAVIDEAGMVEVFQRRPDLFAVLDVMLPEPPVPSNPLFDPAECHHYATHRRVHEPGMPARRGVCGRGIGPLSAGRTDAGGDNPGSAGVHSVVSHANTRQLSS